MPIAEPFAVVLLLVSAGYAGFMGWLVWRVHRPAEPAPTMEAGALPHLAIVVAARDEEETLPRCLEALRSQDYPADRAQIWIADDHSEDGTAEVVRQFAATDGIPVHYIRVPDPVGPLRGKAQALHTAIEALASASAPPEVVLITDADCAPVTTWARQAASRFADSDTGLLCGLARIAPRPGHAFDRVQALDWMFMLGAASALAESGQTATGMGNNMSIRAETYAAVGGYPALPFSVTEDFTLVRAVAEETPWRVRFPLDPAATVWTLPAHGLRPAYAQRRRWARGGLTGGGWVIATYTLLHLVHLVPLLGLAFSPLAALLTLGLKGLCDLGFLATVLHRAGDPAPVRTVARDGLGFEAFLFAYMVTLPSVLLFRPRIEWKGRSL
ncbi:MAG: glycosyltransferase [Bacteroidota bacterium]